MYLSNHVCCIICRKECSVKGIHTHYMRAHTNTKKFNSTPPTHVKCSCVICKKEISTCNINAHYKSMHTPKPQKQCPKCNTMHSKPGPFCSRSCSNSRTHTAESRAKISKKLTGRFSGTAGRKRLATSIAKGVNTRRANGSYKKNNKKNKKFSNKVGPYCAVYHNKCTVCNKVSLEKSFRKYCSEHSSLLTNKRAIYKFRFNVYDYPDLFDLKLLSEVGFYAPRGKAGKWNPTGLSRDHRVSVDEAIRNNYDPYYITHPLNCELMPHLENNSKNTASSITYTQLITLVDAYDKMYSVRRA